MPPGGVTDAGTRPTKSSVPKPRTVTARAAVGVVGVVGPVPVSAATQRGFASLNRARAVDALRAALRPRVRRRARCGPVAFLA